MAEYQDASSRNSALVVVRRGRPRSDAAHRAILEAAQQILIAGSYADMRLEHVATAAGVAKSTIYRRWKSKEELVLDLLLELATPHLSVGETGNTRDELIATIRNVVTALTKTPFGPVMKALLAQIATNPSLSEPFRATVVKVRRQEVGRVIQRGKQRGDLRPDVSVAIATELLVGPVYYRLMFGGNIDRAFAVQLVDELLAGYRPRSN